MAQNNTKNWIREVELWKSSIKFAQAFPKLVALACFFLSGACGLIYQVTWTRMLGLVFGNTVFATSTVLTAFMSGLALGSFLAGRYADRALRSLRIYASLEIGIGIYCVLIPILIKLTEGAYIPLQKSLQLSFYLFSLVRFILCFLLLLIPATLMGATTPFFSRFYVERGEQFGHGIGRVYAVNTFGAFAGVIASGFFMIERLGVRNTINAAVAGNILVAIICLLMDFRWNFGKAPFRESKIKRESPALSGEQRVIFIALMIGFGVSGFSALVYEVAWTRILAMIIGSSIYAFSIMLATFLMGLALGSFIFSIIAKRRTINLLWFASAEIIIGFAAILMLPLFEKLPLYLVSLFTRLGFSYIALELGKFLLCSLVMIVPTILLGSLFPMVTQICTRDYSELGRKVGTIYSVNTLGDIAGSFVSGFILIPYIGIQNSVILAASLNLAVGCILFLPYQAVKLKYRAIVSLAAAAVGFSCVLLIPSWNRMIISSGASVYAQRYSEFEGRDRKIGLAGFGEQLLYYKEGLEATVAVKRRPHTGTVVMTVNGKVDASNSGDMYTQLMVGHLPLLFSSDLKTALVIGLGSGVTLGAAAQHPLMHIDCVEIEPAVVEASRFFSVENRDVLEDDRVNLIVNDGRNYLATTLQKYDVIISEPSNLWLAGMANLFSLEFYKLCKEHLNPNGTIVQWVHIYHMSPEDVAVAIKTFKSVFPHTSLWFTMLGDLFMLGTPEEFVLDYLELAQRYNIPGVLEDMQRLNIREPLALLSCYLLDEKSVAAFTADAPINTDNKPILEYSTPRSLYVDSSNLNHRRISAFRTEEFPKMKNFSQRVTSRVSFWYHLGIAYDFKDMPYEASRHYQKAISLDPDFAPAYVGLALDLYKDEKVTEAIDNLKKAIALDPYGADAYYNLAQIYEEQGSRDEAISNYRSAIRLSPQPWKYQQKLADLLVERGDYSMAIQEYEAALKGGISKSRILYSTARAYKAAGMNDTAIIKIQEAIAIEPSYAPLYEEMGDLYEAKKEYEKAIAAYKKLIELEPASDLGYLKLSEVQKLQRK